MTKKQFIKFCLQRGILCNYSGKTNTMYVQSGTYQDISVEAVQFYGFSPDFQIREV